MKFSNKLKAWLIKYKIKDSQFAREIKVSPSMIGRYKNNISMPNYHTAKRIALFTDYYISMNDMGF